MMPYWYEKGREFAFDVLAGLNSASIFRPQDAMREWFDFHSGSGLFDCDELRDMARWALTVASARIEFTKGYRDAMRETRPARRIAAIREGGNL